MEQPILSGLTAYNTEGCYPWHMPGHKRRLNTIFPDIVENPFSIDVTEVGDLDEFHDPHGIISEAMNRAAEVYGSHKSYYLVNGSTCGIMAALSAVCRPGDKLIVARNCHKSVYNAIRLLQLRPIYIMPEWNEKLGMFGGVSPEQVRKMVKQYTDAKCVMLVSPTYEGVVSDVEKIAKIVHKAGVPLIVDEAHGAHLPFMPKRNLSAVAAGADLVIQSTHKTLPSLTQTALLHVNRKELVPKVERYLHIFQTSSPSYLFTQSMEKAVVYAGNHPEVFDAYRKRLKHFRKKCKELRHIRLLQPKQTCYAYDKGKLVFTVSGVHPAEPRTDSRNDIPATGPWLAHVLAAEYQQVVEMAGTHHVILMTSFADKKKAFEHLYEILKHIDSELTEAADKARRNADQMNHADSMSVLPDMENTVLCSTGFHLPEQVMTPGAAWRLDSSREKLEEAEGSIAADYVYAYPPGIAVITPGEKIDGQVIRDIMQMVETGLNMIGVEYQTDGIYIPVTEPVR